MQDFKRITEYEVYVSHPPDFRNGSETRAFLAFVEGLEALPMAHGHDQRQFWLEEFLGRQLTSHMELSKQGEKPERVLNSGEVQRWNDVVEVDVVDEVEEVDKRVSRHLQCSARDRGRERDRESEKVTEGAQWCAQKPPRKKNGFCRA